MTSGLDWSWGILISFHNKRPLTLPMMFAFCVEIPNMLTTINFMTTKGVPAKHINQLGFTAFFGYKCLIFFIFISPNQHYICCVWLIHFWNWSETSHKWFPSSILRYVYLTDEIDKQLNIKLKCKKYLVLAIYNWIALLKCLEVYLKRGI